MKLSERTVQEYMEEMKTEKFPPIVVVQTDDGYILADGFHRCEAAERLHGRDADINTLCKPGTKRDALLYALGANNKHGLRRTNEDKRHTVLLALQDNELKQESNRSLARICGVSEFMIRSIREVRGYQETCDKIAPPPPPAQSDPPAPPPAAPPAEGDPPAPPAEGEAYAPAQQPATYIKSVGWNWRRANDEFIARSPTGAEIRQSSLPDLAVRVNEFIERTKRRTCGTAEGESAEGEAYAPAPTPASPPCYKCGIPSATHKRQIRGHTIWLCSNCAAEGEAADGTHEQKCRTCGTTESREWIGHAGSWLCQQCYMAATLPPSEIAPAEGAPGVDQITLYNVHLVGELKANGRVWTDDRKRAIELMERALREAMKDVLEHDEIMCKMRVYIRYADELAEEQAA